MVGEGGNQEEVSVCLGQLRGGEYIYLRAQGIKNNQGP